MTRRASCLVSVTHARRRKVAALRAAGRRRHDTSDVESDETSLSSAGSGGADDKDGEEGADDATKADTSAEGDEADDSARAASAFNELSLLLNETLPQCFNREVRGP